MPLRTLLASLWTALIFGLCWLPRTMMPADESGPRVQLIPHLDKVVHFCLFFGFAWLWCRARPARPWAVLLAGVTVAIASELGQMLPIVNRDAGLADGLADCAGILAGLGAYRLIRKVGELRPTPAA